MSGSHELALLPRLVAGVVASVLVLVGVNAAVIASTNQAVARLENDLAHYHQPAQISLTNLRFYLSEAHALVHDAEPQRAARELGFLIGDEIRNLEAIHARATTELFTNALTRVRDAYRRALITPGAQAVEDLTRVDPERLRALGVRVEQLRRLHLQASAADSGELSEAARLRTLSVAAVSTLSILIGAFLIARILLATRRAVRRQRGYEAELQAHRDNLEELVGERTRDLQKAKEDMESFSYSVSHDLRAPLRAIDGFSEMLREQYAGRLGETGQDFIRRIRANVGRMALLIDDLLRLSRLGRAEVHRERIVLAEMARNVMDALADRHRAVEFDCAVDDVVYADPKLLRIVFENLLDNALKYSRDSTRPAITVGTGQRGRQRVIFVRDNGVGFDMQYAHKLFGIFERLHGAEFEGTGIGLVTVQRIVHTHGGEIWAQASPGAGATFSFTLGEQATVNEAVERAA